VLYVAAGIRGPEDRPYMKRPEDRSIRHAGGQLVLPPAALTGVRQTAPRDSRLPSAGVGSPRIGPPPSYGQDAVIMTATDARIQLQRLEAERLDAVEAGLGENALYMDDLHNDIAASRALYIGLAVTEIATLRAQLSGPQVG
jgi:hypothetical protein